MRRVVLLVIVALALGGFVGYGTYVYLQQAEDRALSRYELVEVLISRESIPEGTSLADAVSEGLAGLSEFPSDYVPSNALREVTPDRANLVTLEELASGQILLTGDFVPAPDAPRLLEIPDGMVAVSLSLPEQARLGPFLQPGDQVAVLATSSTGGSNGPQIVTRVLVPRVQVLAVGASTGAQAPVVGQASTEGLVTVALEPSDLALVTNAASTATVYLGMLGDEVSVARDDSVSGP